MNYELINVESLDINEYKSDVIVESENSPSNASNEAGSSINDTYHYINQSPIKLGKEEIINNVYEKNGLDKYKSTSKLIKGTVNNDLINNLEILNIDEYEHKSGIMMKSENSSPSSTSNQTTEPSIGDTYIHRNQLLLKLENEGFITPDEKVKELVKELTEPKFLYALKLLFENLQNKFSSKILISSLNSLADPNLFKYYSEENLVKLELHLRAWVAVLERIHFSPSPIVLSKDLLDEVCNSLAKFAEVYYEAIQVIDKSSFNQQGDNRYNYNIDFLLIYLRDTLHGLYSLYDDSTWFQELLRKIKDLLNTILSSKEIISDENYSILLMITQLRKELSFKYSIPSYYIDLRIMLIIQHNLFIWSEDSEKIISKKFAEMLLMEHIWSFLEREWDNVADKSILDSQVKFDIVSKSLKNNRNFLNKNNFTGNEPLVLPHTLWFGLLDLAQNLIQKSTRKATYGLCYYLAIESLNKAPSNFIQFKAVEILLNLHNINNQMFSMIEDDFDQYTQKLNEDNLTCFSEKFQTLLKFVKEKYLEDYKIINDIGKGKGKGNSLNQNTTYLKEKRISNSYNIIDIIADEITCPISSEPTDQICILKCQHIFSLNNLKKLKQKKCPQCREKLEDNDIRYLSQNTIYKNLYPQFFEAGRILPTIELENSEQITNDQYDSDSDNSEVDLILTKKKKFMKAIKLSSNILSSILPRISKKQHPLYQNIIKELDGKYYQKAESLCKEFLKLFPGSYSVRCILAYIYRYLKNYEQAQLYLKEAIELKPKKSIAYFIYGELLFLQSEYEKAINNLNLSLECKAKSIVNLHIILGNSFLRIFDYDNALNNYNIGLKNDPNNNLCLKNCAYIYEKQEDYINCLKILGNLLNINDKDSLILCYYGEILENLGKYDEAVTFFTKASNLDPENIHNLNKRAIAYFVLQEYDKALLDLDKVIQLEPLNNLAYYNKGLTHYTLGSIKNAVAAFKKCVELDFGDNLSRIQLYYMECLQYKNSCGDLEYDYDINQISDIENNYLLLFIKCIINIKFKKYDIAMSDLSKLFYNYKNISFVYLLQEYQDFWSYLYKNHQTSPFDFTELGIIDNFNKYMYYGKRILYLKDILLINS
jgi:tetratricopeptide (TPR) repeat protein